ncbi:MAG TPA: hypothetical protein VLI04_15200 [Nocardioidaceae bacterium]|nr:hypothetical protein [Nocardioidaceae bacterium]
MEKPDQTDPKRFKTLPEPVSLEDTIETSDVDPHAPVNDGPLDEVNWLLKNASP